MSTVLINTTGKSPLERETNLLSDELVTKLGLDAGKIKVNVNNTDPEPDLTPLSKSGIIDVVNDFSWYGGPKATSEALDLVPCAFLTERKQLLSSLVSGALYYLNAGAQVLKGASGPVSDFLKSTLGQFTDGNGGLLDTIGEKAIGGIQSLSDAITNGADAIDGFAGSDSDNELLKNTHLKSLQGIYFTKPTGFKYRLPIFEQSTTIEPQWGEDNPNSILGSVVSTVQGAADTAANIVNLTQPGTYIEKPQYFQGVDQGTETISFPLANTIRRNNQSPVQQNYELLWLLAFQNKAFKTSFSRVSPPKIYTVNVPGRFTMPYAYISNMGVEFLGTVRKQKVTVPTAQPGHEYYLKFSEIEVPVPEAYQVSLTFTSLIKDYSNTMIGSFFGASVKENGATFGLSE